MYCDNQYSQENSINILKYSLFSLKWLHPILVFTTEEVFQILKSNSKNTEKFEESIFLVDFKRINNQNDINFNVSAWEVLQKIKTEINQI